MYYLFALQVEYRHEKVAIADASKKPVIQVEAIHDLNILLALSGARVPCCPDVYHCVRSSSSSPLCVDIPVAV